MTDIDISPEAVERLAARHASLVNDHTAATLRAISAALTLHQNDASYQCRERVKEWERANATELALAQSRAETAAAFDAAAQLVSEYPHIMLMTPDQKRVCVHLSQVLRALATPDQSSALAAIEAAAEARGMQKAAGIVDADIQKVQSEMTRRAQRLAAAKAPGFQYAIHWADLDARISCRDKILAAIPQGEK